MLCFLKITKTKDDVQNDSELIATHHCQKTFRLTTKAVLSYIVNKQVFTKHDTNIRDMQNYTALGTIHFKPAWLRNKVRGNITP
jgi:hypothetical protein